MIDGKHVRCVEVDRDQYKRLVGQCFIDNSDIEREIGEGGPKPSVALSAKKISPDRSGPVSPRRGRSPTAKAKACGALRLNHPPPIAAAIPATERLAALIWATDGEISCFGETLGDPSLLFQAAGSAAFGTIPPLTWADVPICRGDVLLQALRPHTSKVVALDARSHGRGSWRKAVRLQIFHLRLPHETKFVPVQPPSLRSGLRCAPLSPCLMNDHRNHHK